MSTDVRTNTDVVVVAPPEVAAGFALGGAAVCTVRPDDDAVAAVEEAARGSVVTLVHAQVWARLPLAARDTWSASTDVLVVALPPDDDGELDHESALHRLLARAVGYEISFTPEGGPS
ncbi:MAG: hypothetical protein ACRCY8_07025 [Dermatophilaceae bacterium]